jgi:alkaline phosphatase D
VGCWLALGGSTLWGQVVSGPWLGELTVSEATLGFETTDTDDHAVQYWPVADPARRTTVPARRVSPAFHPTTVWQAVLPLRLPDREFEYRLVRTDRRTGKTHTLAPVHSQTFTAPINWQYRRPAPDVRIALGSCFYVNDSLYDRPGKPYGGEYAILNRIADQRPDLMLWLGDNTYLREADYTSPSGIWYRYGHTRRLPELQPLLANTPQYAIWDDHDYGPNDSDRSYILKAETRSAFLAYWPRHGSTTLAAPALTHQFERSDAHFFLLDNRTFRTPNGLVTDSCTQLGHHQFDWLIDALKASRARFKFVVVGGQVLTSFRRFETYANTCPAERDRLLNRLRAERIDGVVFLTGDRHHSELTCLPVANAYPLYDWTVSPLTARAVAEPQDVNPHRVAGSLFGERNFGVIDLVGPSDDRRAVLRLFNARGDQVWSKTIRAAELCFPQP